MNFEWLDREKRAQELNEELESHVTMAAEDLVARGASKTAAAQAARRELGNFSLLKEVTQDAWGGRWWRDLLEDSRHGLRILRKNPGFTAVAVLTLALGIGANTAIFSVLDSALLKSLPVAHPEQLVVLTDPDAHGGQFGSQTGDRSLLAYSEFEYLRDHNDLFAGILAADSSLPDMEVNLGDSSAGSGGKKETDRVKLVTGDYFATLGIKPAAGRMFGTEVDRARGGSPIAVVSYVFWRQRFGLNPSMLGRTIQIGRSSFEIVGVAPPEFFGETVGEAPDIWIPMMMQDTIYPGRDLLSPSPQGITNQHMWIQVMARLKPDLPLAQARTRINVVFKRMLESAAGSAMTAAEPRNYLDQRLNVQPGAHGASTLHADFGTPLLFLMVLVGLVLLIACANVANLVLARGAARQKEFAMRIAIGAGRVRLIRQLLAESLLLAFLGAFAGVVLAYWADTLLLRVVSQAATRPGAIQLHLIPDLRVLGFTLGVTVLTTILFGLIPSLHVTRPNLSPVLKSATVGVSGEPVRGRLPLGKMLVVTQVAISLVLLVAAGLFVHSLSRLSQVNLGYNRENLLLFRVNATAGGYKGAAGTRMYRQLLERISAIPGLHGATVSHNGLFSHSESGDPIAVEGYTPKPNEEMDAAFDHVGPGYFSTMGIPILMGREIGLEDSSAGVRGGVINETFARRFFPNVNPIGKRVRDTYPGNPADMEVVGVAADAKYNSLREETPPRVYAPLFNPMWEQAAAIYEVRTFADPASVSVALRKAVEETSASLPAIEIHTMAGLVDGSLETDRFVEKLSGAFGVLAMLLASIGLYGIMSYTVASRTRDIGIRLALGAAKENVLWQVLRETLALVLIGTAIGVPLALGGTHVVKSMLFGLGFADPLAILFAATVLALVAAVAGFLPAWRASQVDPMVALRHE